MADVKRSPNRTANWDLAMAHSRGGIVHSFSELLIPVMSLGHSEIMSLAVPT
jgi:hypothetical protein